MEQTTTSVVPQYAAPGKGGINRLLSVLRIPDIITDPVSLAKETSAKYGPVTIWNAGVFDLTYLFGNEQYKPREFYDWLMKQPGEDMRIGAVIAKIPTVGYWFDKTSDDPDYVQKLVVPGRQFMANVLFSSERVHQMDATIDIVLKTYINQWREKTSINFTTELVELFHEAACASILGLDLWVKIREIRKDMREIADGIEIPHTTGTILRGRFDSKYRATKRVEKFLKSALQDPEVQDTWFYREMCKVIVDGKPIADRDLPWFTMWTVWNAVTYPGGYGMWSMVDMLGDTKVLNAFASSTREERQTLLDHCLTETIRINPISSVIRNPSRSIEVTIGDKTWKLPDKGFVGVFTMGINHDPELFASPETYDPFRYYNKDTNKPITFGKGAFGCPAQRPTRKIITRIASRLLSEFEFTLPQVIEAKYVCVHLTYAKNDIVVGIKPATIN